MGINLRALTTTPSNLFKNCRWLFAAAKPCFYSNTIRGRKTSSTEQSDFHQRCGFFSNLTARNNFGCLLRSVKSNGINSNTFEDSRCFHSSSAKHRNSKSFSPSDTDMLPSWPAESPDTLIEAWFYTVAPTGAVNLNLPFNTVVKSLNPQLYPDMDKVIMEVHYDVRSSDTLPPSQDLSSIGDMYKFDVGFDKDVAKLNIASHVISGVTLPVVCMLWIPLQSDLIAAVLFDKDLTVERLEGNKLDLSTQQGNCCLKSLKCGSVNVRSSSGTIVTRSTVLGNSVFYVGMSGGIQADKIQGSNVVCHTEMGDINVKSLYADTTTVHTTGGTIQLGQCHGQMILQAGHSHVKIGSMEGDVDIGLHSGSVNLHLSKHLQSNIDIKDGDIHLSFPDGTNTDLNLDCHTAKFDENVEVELVDTDLPNHLEGHIGEKGQASIHARTLSGSINVKLLNWIHSTNLAFQQD